MKNFSVLKTDNLLIRNIIDFSVLILTAFVEAIAIQWFLVPNHVFTGGFNGISQMLSLLVKTITGLNVSTGVFILIMSLAIGVIGWKMVGSRFTILSTLDSVLISILVIFVPEINLAHNSLLAAIFAGVLVGVGIGLSMRFGFSTGGMDIVVMIFQKRTGRTVGFITNIINISIILVAGFFIGWENALYTIISIYATSQTIDAIYTNNQKLTAFIVTSKGKAIIKALQKDLIRGITVLSSKGGYSSKESETLMIVINRAELYELRQIVLNNDENAFINIINTTELSGLFLDSERQHAIKTGKEVLYNKTQN
jgi:uncharacterized membrane-anchored protein YitT (DUF2179 family)